MDRGGQLFLTLFQDDWGDFIRTRCIKSINDEGLCSQMFSVHELLLIHRCSEEIKESDEVRSTTDLRNVNKKSKTGDEVSL